MFDVVLLMAGSGTRTLLPYNKIFYQINGQPLFMFSLEVFLSFPECARIVLVVKEGEEEKVLAALDSIDQTRIYVVPGGSQRQDSVASGMKICQEETVLIHDGARPCLLKSDVERLLEVVKTAPAAALAIPLTDTIRQKQTSGYRVLDRSTLMAMQTPQAVQRKHYLEALAFAQAEGFYGTDDLELLERYLQIEPVLVFGDARNLKVTSPADLKMVDAYLQGGKRHYKIGHSHDTHRFVFGRPLILGGVTIPCEKGLLGHSDADIVYHVVSEAIIGALGLGDLGQHFPDTDPSFHNISSSYFVTTAKQLLIDHQYQISNLDITIHLEEPHLKIYKDQMKNNLASLLEIDSCCINVKATRGEGLGFIGQKQGVSAECVVLLYPK
ncbi:MAG TPA: 2-C-methyl-D-erythritol 4-phosphate cytidylyltransferase [Bacilli bacterium]|nr:MAG: Bifunctional enzyme IspD/IspF [Tenericutes bacterium ADurb.BinA124]HNZ50389.1 2-C-methyl-D-erythritol 4-phosphate cytidylyltransferase [Bacilli bacterium]HPX83796.1 2-C-methyl-D-erythritol 4-phosphate cytidylyltransferase [Bacilli bacterium]